MADINIYGRLWCQTTDGEIVSAAQVKDSDYSGGSMFQHAINEALLAKVNSIEAASSGITWDTLDVPEIVKTLVDVGDFVSSVSAGTNVLNINYGGTTGSESIGLKTINGTSILGSGDITVDLSLYKVVTALPTSDIDTDKIYLVLSGTSGTGNLYTEYIYVNSAWEKVGEYQATVDLTDYVTASDLTSKLSDYYKKDDGLLLDDNASTLVSTLVGIVNPAGDSELTSETVEQYFASLNYTLPTASASELGGVKTGYTTSGKNYGVQVDSDGNAYVNVPWENTTGGEADSVSWNNISDMPELVFNLGEYADSAITSLSYSSDTKQLTYGYVDNTEEHTEMSGTIDLSDLLATSDIRAITTDELDEICV